MIRSVCAISTALLHVHACRIGVAPFCGLPFVVFCSFFFFNDTATTEIYTLSLHDALPIYRIWRVLHAVSAIKCHHSLFKLASALHPEQARELDQNDLTVQRIGKTCTIGPNTDRKSTRLNSSHWPISYAVFCLKKKKNKQYIKKRERKKCHLN